MSAPNVVMAGWVDPTCLLVVEDDVALSAVIVETLSTICPRVRAASTVAEAIAECSRETPDLIVLDLGFARRRWVAAAVSSAGADKRTNRRAVRPRKRR